MDKNREKRRSRLKKHIRVRKKVSGTKECPRMCVYRSARNIFCQLVDDDAAHTLIGVSTRDKEFRAQTQWGGNVKAAELLGKLVATRALASGINKVVFDRAGYQFHGRVKAVADAARKGGLKF